jgi:hypothetical protein
MLIFCNLLYRKYLSALLFPESANRVGGCDVALENVLLQLKELELTT